MENEKKVITIVTIISGIVTICACIITISVFFYGMKSELESTRADIGALKQEILVLASIANKPCQCASNDVGNSNRSGDVEVHVGTLSTQNYNQSNGRKGKPIRTPRISVEQCETDCSLAASKELKQCDTNDREAHIRCNALIAEEEKICKLACI